MPILSSMGGLSAGAYGMFNAASTAYESIATVNLTTATSFAEFTSISPGYKHLQIRGIIMNSSGQNNVAIQVGNGSVDTATNYSGHQVQGNGATTSANAATTQTFMGLSGLVTSTATYPFVFVYDILDYASTSKNKTFKGISGQEGNGTGTATNWRVQSSSGVWRTSGTAINTVRISLPSFTMGNLSSFALYGIRG
jgi:hypothetical protein